MTEQEKREYANKNPLALASLGDAVMTLFMRDNIVKNHDIKVDRIHKEVAKVVNAKQQSIFYDLIYDCLDEVEADIARRAINKKVNTIPKSATLAEYKKATALEAIIGYLYLVKNLERIQELIQQAMIRGMTL
ncbi:MAG: Mini-ribonuclease 3 [Firmicutes bacterium]|nr:Mini-ribonuclease 3 [Bacillota bacterium]